MCERKREEGRKEGRGRRETLFFVNAEDLHDVLAADSEMLVDAADALSRDLAAHDHALDVVVFEERDKGAKVFDGLDFDHHKIVVVWQLVLVHRTVLERLARGRTVCV